MATQAYLEHLLSSVEHGVSCVEHVPGCSLRQLLYEEVYIGRGVLRFFTFKRVASTVHTQMSCLGDTDRIGKVLDPASSLLLWMEGSS